MGKDYQQVELSYLSLFEDNNTPERALWFAVLVSYATDMKAIRYSQLKNPRNVKLLELKEILLAEAFDQWCEEICNFVSVDVKNFRESLIRISRMDMKQLRKIQVLKAGNRHDSLCNVATRKELSLILF